VMVRRCSTSLAISIPMPLASPSLNHKPLIK
jgi:hypothetical protein